ncbi:hypothetical protein QBC35DRAFT_40198 [Podospora australis]|uniref:Uncharacterized protein n=1 Tax=Podospora australis TaxID=1536484 RepID=A0AAN6WQY6_9PEZI|nr:hypothetical protein QBC35DRAFT_40198 [Podospora australis]
MNPSPDTQYHIKPGSKDSDCLAALPGLDGADSFPLRTRPCGSDETMWYLVPDGNGRLFIPNEAWPKSLRRLDFIQQDDSKMFMPFMGPAGDIYNNQRWILTGVNSDKSGTLFMVRSYGLETHVLATAEADGGSVGALLKKESEVSGSAGVWYIGEANVQAVVPSSSPTPSPSPPPSPAPAPAPSSAAPPGAKESPYASTSLASSAPAPSSDQETRGVPTSGTDTLFRLFPSTTFTTETRTSSSGAVPPTSTSNGNGTISGGGTNSPQISTATIAGISVGSVLGVAAIIIIAIVIRRCFLRKKPEATSANPQNDQLASTSEDEAPNPTGPTALTVQSPPAAQDVILRPSAVDAKPPPSSSSAGATRPDRERPGLTREQSSQNQHTTVNFACYHHVTPPVSRNGEQTPSPTPGSSTIHNNNFSNHGSGIQSNHLGTGDQNMNSGAAPQYNLRGSVSALPLR